ncbi:hypothetical protein EE612_048972 [Oryza sativa]|nr:hypothetical protein EE612_048972 [Oryza sativa]
MAFLAFSFQPLAFSMNSLLLSPSITSLTHLSNSSFLTTPSPSGRTRTPTRHTSSMYLAFIVWSDHCGTATIGTPALNPSVVEFHPQCVTKHPTAGCASTSSCGHHVTMSPLPCFAALAAKPSGILEVSDALTTQRKGLPVLYKPSATSAICAGLGVATLPKETYATVRGGLASSQAFVSVVGEKRWKPYDVSSGRRLSRYADGTVSPTVLARHADAMCSASYQQATTLIKELTRTWSAMSRPLNWFTRRSRYAGLSSVFAMNVGTSSSVRPTEIPGSRRGSSPSAASGSSTRPVNTLSYAAFTAHA